MRMASPTRKNRAIKACSTAQGRHTTHGGLCFLKKDLAKAHLNFPEGCMSPTIIKPTPDNRGTILTFRLDHAISSKGMGIALPTVAQPGETTTAVLSEVERGWLLTFAMLVLGLTLSGATQAVLLSVFFATAAACAYGLLADFSDFLFGFWGTESIVLLPLFVLLAWLVTRLAPANSAKLLALQLLLFGIAYPCMAGLDSDRQPLYFDISALVFLTFAAGQLVQRFRTANPSLNTVPLNAIA
jgi:hypothetical protein